MSRVFVPVLLAMTSVLSVMDRPCFAYDMLAKGFAFVQARDFRKAIGCFEKASKDSPNDPTPTMFIGNCYNELGQYPKAIEYYKMVLKKTKVNAVIAGNLSDTYQKMGQNDAALRWLKVACALDPSIAKDQKTRALIRKLQDPLSNPLSSLADLDYLSGLKESHIWSPASMPIKVYVVQNPKLPNVSSALTKALSAALDQWCGASGGAITYKIVDSKACANIVYTYTNDPAAVKSDHELGANGSSEVYISKTTKAIDRVSTTILVSEKPGSPIYSGEILTKLCLHELGHGLGLHGHSSSNQDIMFFTANLPNIGPRLSERDKNSIKRLYKHCGSVK